MGYSTSAFGYPACYATIHEMAEQIRIQHVISVNDNDIEHVFYQPLRKHWITRFIHHHPKLKTVLGCNMEASHLKGISQNIINKWFNAVEFTLTEHNIQLRDVYNMDETSFSIGMIQASRVIVNS